MGKELFGKVMMISSVDFARGIKRLFLLFLLNPAQNADKQMYFEPGYDKIGKRISGA